MVRLAFKAFVEAKIEDVFDFIANPANLKLVYPRELDVKIRSVGEPKKGSEFSFEIRALNQRFIWDGIIDEIERPKFFVDRALRSPFKKWVHKHIFAEANGGTEIIDEIEFEAPLGFLGSLFSKRFVSSVIEYRNSMIRKFFGSNVEPFYKDPTLIPLQVGNLASFLLLLVSFLIALNVPTSPILGLVAGLIAWVLAWFFSHDLFHYLVGRALGIRFSNYFLGLSNIVRLGIVRGDAKFLLVALGLRIDRSIKYSGKRLAAMYLSGPLASMVFPALLSLIVLRNNYDAGLVLLLISAINIAFTSYFSPKVGCIAKAMKRIRKQT